MGSVFGPRKNFVIKKGNVKLFFTGENINIEGYEHSDYKKLHTNEVDISIGFDYKDDENYIRFPLWILYYFEPDFAKADISIKIKEFNSRRFPKTEFCSLIARHDRNGIRNNIFNRVDKIAPVKCAGALLYNDNSLKAEYNDDKIEYLKKFKFNICPENSYSKGYVTEKIFQSFWSSAIPIYWGDPDPEPGIINKEAVLFWNEDGNNEDSIERISFLNANEKAYLDFISQNRLLDSATDEIWKMFKILRSQLQNLV